MGMYLESGYINIDWIVSRETIFNVLIGARGIGKTYGALEYCIHNKINFLYLRRTQTQADVAGSPIYCPVKSITQDIYPDRSGKNLYQLIDKDKNVYGYIAALSTFSNLRGFDASEIDWIIFDEFIPEFSERTMKNEGETFLNLYETVNRNRELKGKKPVFVLLMANSNQIASSILLQLQLVRPIAKMIKGKQSYWYDNERSVSIIYPIDSPISQRKAGTALYKLTGAGSFADMALSNVFADMDDPMIKSRPLNEYKPLCAIGEICIYRHKSRNEYYISGHISGKPERYTLSQSDILRFRKHYLWLQLAILQNQVYYEDKVVQLILEKYTG